MRSLFQAASLIAYVAIARGNDCTSPAELASQAFRRLFRPEEVPSTCFWNDDIAKPIVSQAKGRSFKDLFTLEGFQDALRAAPHPYWLRSKSDNFLRGSALLMTRTTKDTGRENHENDQSKNGPAVNMTEITSLFQDGWSIVLLAPHRFFTPIHALTSRLEQYFMMQLNTYIFITPPSKQAFDFHFDSVSAFVMQVEGTKKWTLIPPLVEAPVASMAAPTINLSDVPPELLAKAQTIVLNEGDVMLIPIGWSHLAENIGSVPSTHITITMDKITWSEILHGLGFSLSRERNETESFEQHATKGLPLPLRRTGPCFLHRLPDFALQRALTDVARQANLDVAEDVSNEKLSVWKGDFIAEVLNSMIPVNPDRVGFDHPASNLDHNTPLRVTSTVAARLTSKAHGGMRILKYSTSNTVERKAGMFNNYWLVSSEAAASLAKVLHVESNPTGKFTPGDIQGINNKRKMQLIDGLVVRGIVVPESQWCNTSRIVV